MRALGAVELEDGGALRGLLFGSVRLRVLDATGLAGTGRKEEVVGVDEEGGRRDGQDVAVRGGAGSAN